MLLKKIILCFILLLFYDEAFSREPPCRDFINSRQDPVLSVRCYGYGPGYGNLNDTVLTSDKKYFIWSSNQAVRVWDVNNFKLTLCIAGYNTFKLSRNNRILFTSFRKSSSDYRIKSWDITTGKELYTLGGFFSSHSKEITALALSPDEKILVSADAEKNIFFWDLEKKEKVSRLKGYANLLFFSNDGKELIASSAFGINIWNKKTGNKIFDNNGYDYSVTSSDNKYIGIIYKKSNSFFLLIYDLDKKGILVNHSLQSRRYAGYGFAGRNSFFLITKDDKRNSTFFELFTLPDFKKVSEIETEVDMNMKTYAFSPDHSLLATGDFDGNIRLWDTKLSRLKTVLGKKVDKYRYYRLQFNSTGNVLKLNIEESDQIFCYKYDVYTYKLLNKRKINYMNNNIIFKINESVALVPLFDRLFKIINYKKDDFLGFLAFEGDMFCFVDKWGYFEHHGDYLSYLYWTCNNSMISFRFFNKFFIIKGLYKKIIENGFSEKRDPVIQKLAGKITDFDNEKFYVDLGKTNINYKVGDLFFIIVKRKRYYIRISKEFKYDKTNILLPDNKRKYKEWLRRVPFEMVNKEQNSVIKEIYGLAVFRYN